MTELRNSLSVGFLLKLSKILYPKNNQSILKSRLENPSVEHKYYTLKDKKVPYLLGNHGKVNSEVREVEKGISEASKMPINDSFQNRFTTLGKISEEKKAKIIEKGFQLEAEGKISLKKYYESRQEFSLFQLNGYSIKYESIRHNKIYIQLKQSMESARISHSP